MNSDDLAAVLGRIPSGLFILTVRHEGQETGMLASWVMQAGFEPPAVSVAVKQGRYVADWLAAGAPFALNLLGENHKSLLSHFGRGFEPGEPAFEGLQVERTESGVPTLVDALGCLVCQPTAHADSADHRVFIATVAEARSREGAPYVHVRKNGLRY